MIIAIDGPAASGKSTVAKAVASRLGLHYLDTGAMYRSIALAALERSVPLDDRETLSAIARAADIAFQYEPGAGVPTKVLLDGRDVTVAIRTPEVDAAVSDVARVPAVRAAMVAAQRRIAAEEGNAVVEGRDIGTVVFPHAEVKVFLDASGDERARRRHAEHEREGHAVGVDAVREALERRDELDSTREESPLAAAPDAKRIDTTGRDPAGVVEEVVRLAGAAGGAR